MSSCFANPNSLVTIYCYWYISIFLPIFIKIPEKIFLSIAGANSRTKLVNFGTKPNKKLTDWKDIKPIPIKIELTPIVNLFNPTNLDEKHNISSSDILDWFLPLYLKYCKVSSYPLTFPTFRIPIMIVLPSWLEFLSILVLL